MTADSTPKTILIVDDDVDFLIPLEAQLRAKGFDVISANGKDEALQAIEGKPVDLAVLDLMMEHMDDGFALCYELKALNAELPVILATGVAAETGIEFEAVTEGERGWIKADVVLSKPLRMEQLMREVDRLLKD
jgi:CheY-like chemotaxis protein